MKKTFNVRESKTHKQTNKGTWIKQEQPGSRSNVYGNSLAVQWLRLRLPMQGVRVRSIPGQRAKIPQASQPKKTKHKTEEIL